MKFMKPIQSQATLPLLPTGQNDFTADSYMWLLLHVNTLQHSLVAEADGGSD